MEGQYFLSTDIKSGVFVVLFWNNGLNSIEWSACPYVGRKKEEKDSLLLCFDSKTK